MLHFVSKQCSCCILMFSLMYSCGNERESNREIAASEPTPNNVNTLVKNTANENTIINANNMQDYDKSLGGDNTSDPFKLPVISKIKGTHLKAISIALATFSIDDLIPESKRSIQNYDVELRQNKDFFFVYFSAHSSPQDQLQLAEGGETSLGKSVMFVVTKKDLAIKKRYFFK